MKFKEKVCNGPMNKCLNVSGDPVADSDTVPDPDRDTDFQLCFCIHYVCV